MPKVRQNKKYYQIIKDGSIWCFFPIPALSFDWPLVSVLSHSFSYLSPFVKKKRDRKSKAHWNIDNGFIELGEREKDRKKYCYLEKWVETLCSGRGMNWNHGPYWYLLALRLYIVPDRHCLSYQESLIFFFVEIDIMIMTFNLNRHFFPRERQKKKTYRKSVGARWVWMGQ